MIVYSNSHYDNIGFVNTIERACTIEQALDILINEFMFSTFVQDIGIDIVRVCTSIFGSRDEITFSGTEGEMELLVEAARTYRMFDANATPHATLASFVAGCSKAEAVAKIMILSKCKDVSLDLKCELGDLVALMLLIRKDNIDPHEAVALIQ